MPKKDTYYIQVVGKAIDVLEVFVLASKRQLSLPEIARQLRLNKNAVFRILYTLAEHGYVVKEDQKYELGPKVVDLSNSRLRYTDLLTVAGPVLDELRNRFRETVSLGVLDKDLIRYVGVWESRERFRLAEHVGASDMLHCTALGKAYLSCLPFDEVRQLVRSRGLPAHTPHTITSLQALKSELESTRKRGYAFDLEESVLGAACVATAIQSDEGNRPAAVVSLSGPLARLNDACRHELGRALRQAARQIQGKVGIGTSAPKRSEGIKENKTI
jgi:IclR family transcriptional regulator, KDG regulon repressor